MTLKERFESLTSRQRLSLITAGVVLAIGLSGLVLWSVRATKREESAKTGEIGRVAMTSDLLEDTLTERVEGRVVNLEKSNEALLEKVNEMIAAMNAERAKDARKIEEIERRARSKLAGLDAKAAARARSEAPVSVDTAPKNELAALGAYRVGDSYPAPPQLATPIPPAGLRSADYEPPEPKILGGIAAMPNPVSGDGFDASQKKRRRSFCRLVS